MDEKMYIYIPSGDHGPCGVCTLSPCLQVLQFPPTSQSCMRAESRPASTVLSESVGVSGCIKEGCPVQVGPACTLSCWERLLPPVTLKWNQQVGKSLSYLLLCIFLTYMHSLHLVQCLILEVFGSLFRSLVMLFGHKYAIGT